MPINAGQLIQYLIQAIIVLLLILLMRMLKNGGPKIAAALPPAAGEEPGKGETCIKHTEKIQEHETELEHIIKDLDEEKEDRKLFRKEISTKIGSVHKELRRMNGLK